MLQLTYTNEDKQAKHPFADQLSSRMPPARKRAFYECGLIT